MHDEEYRTNQDEEVRKAEALKKRHLNIFKLYRYLCNSNTFENLKYPTVGMQKAYTMHVQYIQHLYFY